MSKEIKILVIMEGGKTEPNFFNQLISVYGVQAELFPIEGNIYKLYKKMQEYDFLCDVKDALKELPIKKTDKQILDEIFTYTYLVFDCDVHHTNIPQIEKHLWEDVNVNFEHLKEMADYFVDETDPSIGKLYVNYPMMESYRDCNAFFDEEYCHRTVAIQDFVHYKKMAGQQKLANVNINKYTKENFSDLTRMNVYKLHTLCQGEWSPLPYSTYRELSETKNIADTEFQFCQKHRQVQVLNSALFMLIDYYGNRDGFYDRIMQPNNNIQLSI